PTASRTPTRNGSTRTCWTSCRSDPSHLIVLPQPAAGTPRPAFSVPQAAPPPQAGGGSSARHRLPVPRPRGRPGGGTAIPHDRHTAACPTPTPPRERGREQGTPVYPSPRSRGRLGGGHRDPA